MNGKAANLKNIGQPCQKQHICTHNLKFDSLSLELDSPDLEVDLTIRTAYHIEPGHTPMVEM